MEENWKDIEDYKGSYQISNMGRIRSKLYPTKQGTKKSNEWHVLKNFFANGSPQVYLIKNKNRTCAYIAHLVLNAFVGKKPSSKHQAIRLDSDISNVSIDNLKWGKRPEVNALLKHNGLMVVGEDLPQHKLLEREVEQIKDELINGFLTINEIAESFGVSYGCIQAIKENNNWKHVEWPEGEINEHTFRECKFCGDQFKTDRFVYSGQPERYCSDKCRKHQDVLVVEGKTYEEHFGAYEGTCECCGEDYEVDLSVRLEGGKPEYFSRKYCTKKCCNRQSYLNSLGKEYDEVYGITEKECEFCGQLFELGPDDYSGQKYCRSKECDRERERVRSAKRRWNGKGYWDREGKNDKLQRNYT